MSAEPSRREEEERKARVNAMWEQMNNGLPRLPKVAMSRFVSSERKPPATAKRTPGWMVALGLTANRTVATANPAMVGTNEEAKKLAAAALPALKDPSSAASDEETKKLIDEGSKDAAGRAKASNTHPSALDSVLEQIKKKPKLTVLGKTKKDWGEFKEENKGLEDQLDAYKKSSNQYLDKVSFLQRTDLREFERERDARLSLQAKRRSADFQGDDF